MESPTTTTNLTLGDPGFGRAGSHSPAPVRGFLRGLCFAALGASLGTTVCAQTLYRLGDSQVVVRDVNNAGYMVGASTEQAFLGHSGLFYYLGTLPGQTRSYAEAINEYGVIAGTSSTVETYRAFLYDRGGMTDLGTLGGTRSYAYGLNDRGDVVGQSTIAGDAGYHGFLYSKGQMINLGTLGGTMSTATGINNAGDVVGYSFIEGNKAARAYLYTNSRMMELGTLGGSYSNAVAINNRGQIAGTSANAEGSLRAFIYEAGKMIDLGTVARTEHSSAFAINNQGQIVGRCYSSSGYEPAFLYSKGVMADLNVLFEDLLTDGTTLGFVLLVEATSISDTGIITGFGWYHDGWYDNGKARYVLAPFVLNMGSKGAQATNESVTGVNARSDLPDPALTALVPPSDEV